MDEGHDCVDQSTQRLNGSSDARRRLIDPPPPIFSTKCDLSIAPLRSLSELSISFHPHTEATLLAASPSWNPETLRDSVDCWRK
ncbi:hypothetical protein CEXT_108421 [Caerostris extrusa]|uniref:Uncharacterized protein n=1 Tax=Caerostris extrusa TaxID=172846 RepID=A0AAV4SW16_CAEEX|nr:hypothetical protein CEXT_108421 [Caerostris extrusa]